MQKIKSCLLRSGVMTVDEYGIIFLDNSANKNQKRNVLYLTIPIFLRTIRVDTFILNP